MAFKSKYDPSMDDKAMELFKAGKSIVGVCAELGISRETYYTWRDDPAHPFSDIAKEGEKMSQAWWEEKGQEAIFGGIDKFAGSSWQFVMKNRFRDDYSDAPPKDQKDTLIEKLLDKI